MLKDLTKQFKAAYGKNPSLVFDNYTLKEGLYIRFNLKSPEDYDYMVVKKKQELIKDDKYKWFRAADYYSSILEDDMNKAVDTKKQIHSTNEYSLFIKKENFPGMSEYTGKKGQMLDEDYINFVKGYFNSLKNLEDKFWEIYSKSNIKKQEKLSKEQFFDRFFKPETEYLKSDERINEIKQNEEFFLSQLNYIQKILKQIDIEEKFTNYIKLFIYEDITKYEKAYNLYVIPRIFNKNDYNRLINGKIMGLPANNMSLNDKKPYMQLRTMKTGVPTRVSFKDAALYKDFFLWLKAQTKSNMTIKYDYKFDMGIENNSDEPCFDIYLNKKEGVIEEFDNIPFKAEKLEFELKNYLGITQNDGITLEEDETLGRGTLLKRISHYFFADKLEGYFKKAEPKVKANTFTSNMQSLFYISKDAIYDFIVYGVEAPFRAMVDKVTMESITEQLLYTTKGIPKRLGEAYNLRLALLDYFSRGDNKMGDAIKNLNELLKDKLNQKELAVCNSDEEFYYTAGQLTYYILDKSEAKEKTYGMVEPFIHAKTAQDLKNKLKLIFDTYKHAISLYNIRFKNAFSMVMGYDCNTKFTGRMQDIYYAGLLSSNILFQKLNKDNEKGDTQNEK